MYHTTLPTDALMNVRNSVLETKEIGFETCRTKQIELGTRIRKVLESKNYHSVAAEGFKATGVVVVHSPTNDMMPRFAKSGLQVAAGIPFKINEPSDLVR